MASRKMTFTLPEDLARRFLQRVPGRERSRYLANALADKLQESEDRLILSCEAANADPEVLSLERDWGSLPDEVTEPWTDASTR